MTDKLFYDNSPEDKSFLVPLLNVGFLVCYGIAIVSATAS